MMSEELLKEFELVHSIIKVVKPHSKLSESCLESQRPHNQEI